MKLTIVEAIDELRCTVTLNVKSRVMQVDNLW